MPIEEFGPDNETDKPILRSAAQAAVAASARAAPARRRVNEAMEDSWMDCGPLYCARTGPDMGSARGRPATRVRLHPRPEDRSGLARTGEAKPGCGCTPLVSAAPSRR